MTYKTLDSIAGTGHGAVRYAPYDALDVRS